MYGYSFGYIESAPSWKLWPKNLGHNSVIFFIQATPPNPPKGDKNKTGLWSELFWSFQFCKIILATTWQLPRENRFDLSKTIPNGPKMQTSVVEVNVNIIMKIEINISLQMIKIIFSYIIHMYLHIFKPTRLTKSFIE